MKINKALAKSFVRGIYIVVGSIVIAVNTYLAGGNHLGWNAETFWGIFGTLLLPTSTVVQRYLDPSDPAFGSTK